MNDGDVIFMLDGLDEIPDAEQRREQVQAIVKALGTFDRCRIIVTSRPYAYYVEDWQLSDFGHVDLVTLEEDRLNDLAANLFNAVLPDNIDAQLASFNEQMEKVPDELKTSPLFFTLLASIWLTDTDIAEAERLPDTRGKMYRKAVESLIVRWERKDADGQSLTDLIGIDRDDLRRVLERLAYTVLAKINDGDEGDEKDPEVFRSGEITNVLEDLELDDKVRVRVLRDALAERAGIIYAKTTRRYKFSHRSLMEHLSACYLSYADFPQQLVSDVMKTPLKWRNVLELLPDELEKHQLWDFVKAQLPTKKKPLPDGPDDPRWWLLYYACRWLRDHDLLPDDDEIREIYEGRLVKTLAGTIESRAVTPVERAEMGRLLAQHGDPRPGVGLRDDGLPDIVWCEVPAGSFIMGSDEEEDPEAGDDETPQREVHLETYYVAKYSVTNAQYAAFMAAGGYDNDAYWTEAGWERKQSEGWQEPQYWHNTGGNQPNQPVVGVSWYEAYAYSQWLNETLKDRPDGQMVIRLPTEEEWEKAARGTDGRIYPYGNQFNASRANTRDTGIGLASAVGIFTGDDLPYGIHDMSGNVYDWCLTQWRASYVEEAENNDPQGTSRRVLRGGSFIYLANNTRCAFRYHYNPPYRDLSYGFRLSCAPIP